MLAVWRGIERRIASDATGVSPIVTTIRLLSAGLETIDDQIVEIFPGDSDVSPSISKSVRPLFPPSYS